MNEAPDPFWKTAGMPGSTTSSPKRRSPLIYPVIARQVLERTGISRGTCLDVGSGPAPLAIALALQSDLRVTALDSSPKMQSLAARNIHDRGLEGRVIPMARRRPCDPGGPGNLRPRGEQGFVSFLGGSPGGVPGDLPGPETRRHGIYRRGIRQSRKPGRESLAGRKKRGIVDDPDNPSRPRFRKFRPGRSKIRLNPPGSGTTGSSAMIPGSGC